MESPRKMTPQKNEKKHKKNGISDFFSEKTFFLKQFSGLNGSFCNDIWIFFK